MTINTIVNNLRQGAVIAYPTEGVWGLGCDPSNEQAVLKILELKQRPIDKGMILVADKLERFKPYIEKLPLIQSLSCANNSHDQAITWIVKHGGLTPDWLSGGRPTIAIRVSTHPTICQICAAAEMPLVSTSANPSGQPAAKTDSEVSSYFGNLIYDIFPGELGSQNGASEIRDFATGKILREGGK